MSWGGVSEWLWPSKQAAAEQADGRREHPEVSITISDGNDEDSKEESGENTPKASTARSIDEPPAISLDNGNMDNKTTTATSLVRPSPGTSSNTQWASTMGPPPKPPSKTSSSPGLMPPPSRPAVPRGPASSAAAGLRVPTTGPLPNRGPPANSAQRASGGLAPNGAVKTPNARGKVLLSPGHSPMDWAALTKSGDLSGVKGFQRVKPSQLKAMTGRKGKPAWSSWQGKVYNITPYLPFHPGGESELMKGAGRDGTKLFMEAHPWVNWENMLGNCLVGALVAEDDGEKVGGSSLEDMD